MAEDEKLMTLETLKPQLKDVAIKLQGALNLLRDGKEIYTEHKLVGTYNKVIFLLREIDKATKNELVQESETDHSEQLGR